MPFDVFHCDRVTLHEWQQHADPTNAIGLLRARREGPSRGAAEQRDELAPFQLIELHSVPASTAFGRYRIGRD